MWQSPKCHKAAAIVQIPYTFQKSDNGRALLSYVIYNKSPQTSDLASQATWRMDCIPLKCHAVQKREFGNGNKADCTHLCACCQLLRVYPRSACRAESSR